MSFLIDGIATHNIARSQGPTTLLSSAFVDTYLPRRRVNSPFALTLNTVDRGSFTVILPCQVLPGLEFDVALALDWKSQLRDLFLQFGHYVPAAFDPWNMILGVVPSVDGGVLLEPSQMTGTSQFIVDKPVKPVKNVKPVKTVKPVHPGLRSRTSGVVPGNYDPTNLASSSTMSSLSVNASEPISDELSGRDRVECMLSTTKPAYSVFARQSEAYLFDMLQGHGIPRENVDTLYASLSNATPILASVLGVDTTSNPHLEALETMVRARLLSTRLSLVQQFSDLHPAEQALEELEAMPLACLISIAGLHGIPSQDCSPAALRNVIATHLLLGACGSHRFGAFSIGCQSIVGQSFPKVPSGSFTQEEFEQLLQVRLLTQLLPRMSRSVARQILRMHNVEFSLQDGPAKL
ncbi:hypothetical protein R3P38DRAFT_2792219 [Favolaschia claudopus]|uniref:Uncharacterized protein n=1 Tax=Favolaschia claudopus TaxID=2862362 RepID=A0AAW0AGE4_9AGAR